MRNNKYDVLAQTRPNMSQAQSILRQAVKHIPTHGFTLQTIALSAPAGTKLSDTAISALFGPGDAAQRTLIRAWLEEGRLNMSTVTSSSNSGSLSDPGSISMEDILLKRLEWNEPVLPHLKDVRNLLSVFNRTPSDDTY